MSNKSISVRFKLPARLDALAILEKKVQEVMEGVPDSDEIRTAQYNFTLALHELCANIVNHAYGEPGGEIEIELTMELAPELLKAVVIDSGKPFDRDAVSAPNLETPQEHGYGIFLIEALVDEVAYSRLDKGNRWMLALSLSSKTQR